MCQGKGHGASHPDTPGICHISHKFGGASHPDMPGICRTPDEFGGASRLICEEFLTLLTNLEALVPWLQS